MKKRMSLLWSFLMLLLLSSAASGLEALRTWGRPQEVRGARFELWHNEAGWHLRWTGAGSSHHFFGKIWAPDGELVITRRHRLEEGDRVWKEGRGIRFDAYASSGEDGFDFRWRGRELVLDLEMDGKPCRKRIFIGSQGIHPAQQPFVIVRPRPKKGMVWVPGHYGPGGRWIPGHWRKLP